MECMRQYNKVSQTCPNHNQHCSNVSFYIQYMVSVDHWHCTMFVPFFPVECKWKQSNCNILQTVHIHNVLSRLCICANKIKKFQFQNVMFFLFMMRKSSIYSRHMSDWVSFIKPHTSYLICCLKWANAPKTGFLNGYMHL